MTTLAEASLFDGLSPQEPDALLALIKAFAADPRDGKIDLGVGVYRDETGATPVMAAIKAAEAELLKTQTSKSYLGPEGDVGFLELLGALMFGPDASGFTLACVQTPGGTGALRLAAELINAAKPGAKVWVGTPTWPNHPPILAASRLQAVFYPHYDPATRSVQFDQFLHTLNTATPGDVVLLHGACHNPTGADLSPSEWRQTAETIARRGLFPLIDLAYHGLGRGLEEDLEGAKLVLDATGEGLLAYSCDKNFALYRERTGALFALTRNKDRAQTLQSNMAALARANWSMPPDHGAASVRLILESPRLTALWREELDTMRARLNGVRAALARSHPQLAPVGTQRGLFSMLPLSKPQIAGLRDNHAVYMAGSGRINIAGLATASVPRFVSALQSVGM